MTSFKKTPSTSATYSSKFVGFPPANGPNVLTYNRIITMTYFFLVSTVRSYTHIYTHTHLKSLPLNSELMLTHVTRGLDMKTSKRGVKISFSILRAGFSKKERKAKQNQKPV